MRVLMTTDMFGGVFFYSVELCSWLSAHGVSVTLASMGRQLSWEQRDLAHRAGANVVESTYRLECERPVGGRLSGGRMAAGPRAVHSSRHCPSE